MTSSLLTNIIACGIADNWVYIFKGDNFKGGQRSGPWLSGDHSSKAGHTPSSNVIVLTTHYKRSPKRVKKQI